MPPFILSKFSSTGSKFFLCDVAFRACLPFRAVRVACAISRWLKPLFNNLWIEWIMGVSFIGLHHSYNKARAAKGDINLPLLSHFFRYRQACGVPSFTPNLLKNVNVHLKSSFSIEGPADRQWNSFLTTGIIARHHSILSNFHMRKIDFLDEISSLNRLKIELICSIALSSPVSRNTTGNRSSFRKRNSWPRIHRFFNLFFG